VADITHIRLETEFVYLAVVLDAHSRRVIGEALDRALEDQLTHCGVADSFGASYSGARSGASFWPRHRVRAQDYTGPLKDDKINFSMSRKEILTIMAAGF
jgi:putative transposase